MPVAEVVAGLADPARAVLDVDLSPMIRELITADGTACGCTRPIDGGTIGLDGDHSAGYVLVIRGP